MAFCNSFTGKSGNAARRNVNDDSVEKEIEEIAEGRSEFELLSSL